MHTNQIYALDIETSCNVPECTEKDCKHPLDFNKGKIDCVGIYAIDVDHKQVFRDLDQLRTWLNDNPDVKFIGHNFKFDIKFLWANGIELPLERWYGDTQLMAHVCTDKVPDQYLGSYEACRRIANKKLPRGFSHRKARRHSLKVLAPWFLKVPKFWEDPTDHNSDEYVLKDCEYTARLFTMFKEKLALHGHYEFYEKRLLQWTKMLAEAEFRGVQIDLELLDNMEKEYRAKADALKEQLDATWQDAYQAYYDMQDRELKEKYGKMCLHALQKLKKPTPEKENKTKVRYKSLYLAAKSKIPKKIDLDSPKQVLWLFKDYLSLDVTNYKGEETTGIATLEKLAGSRDDIALFLKWRKANKLVTAFFPTYRNIQTNSTIHAHFNPTGTRTGRLSCSDPNLQQVSKELKPLFRARPGYKLLTYDLGAIEAVLIALYSNDLRLTELIKEQISPHDFNTAQIFFKENNWTIDSIKADHPKERKAAKTLGFSLLYGAGAKRIQHAFTAAGFPVNLDEARELHKIYKETYQDATDFHRAVTKEFEAGETIPNLFGRPLTVSAEDAYMKGFNKLIQSSASDLNLVAAYNASKRCRKVGLDFHVLLLIHDSIVAEVAEANAPLASQILIEEMTKFNLTNDLGPIKLEVEGGIDERWT
jgi:DNA polymerase I-like protein with 3'-5' exonuclease and polymerase domains